MNAKTYCSQSSKKWKELHAKAHTLDSLYDEKILELGNLCSSMFKSMSTQNPATQVNEQLEQQMLQNREKVDVVKKFVREVDVLLEKVEAVEAENRADLMVMFVQRLGEY